MLLLLAIAGALIVVLALGSALQNNMVAEERGRLIELTPEQHAAQLFGSLNEHLICPHCQTKGSVRAKSVSRTETSTGKVGGILKTNTKSSITKYVTQHHCDECRTTWDV